MGPELTSRDVAFQDAPLFAKLTPEASEKLRKGTYERMFDQARRTVGAREKGTVH